MTDTWDEGAPPAARPNLAEISVSELSHALKRTLEDAFPYVRLRGEVSGYRGPHASGHAYFALKDANAKIDAVCFKGVFQKLKFKPQEGLEIVATGRITTYPGKSAYQIIVEAIEPAGAGALLALLDERSKKLAAEGLFDDARKKPLPFLPAVIGVVTSPTGAVIRDILHRLSDRFPRRVLLWPVTVQGEKAAAEVAGAIAGFNALPKGGDIPRPDVLIVARGGGSIEDLWAFNEEIVVRAAAASLIPLIAAVGHETDTTLIDYAADRRAPTPTAAAEMAVPVRAELERGLALAGARLVAARTRLIEAARERLRHLARALPRREGLFALPRQRLDMAAGQLQSGLRLLVERHRARLVRASGRLSLASLVQTLGRHHQRLGEIEGRQRAAASRLARDKGVKLSSLGRLLESLGHRATLARGFALVRNQAGALIRSAASIAPGENLNLTFTDGEARVRAEGGSEAKTGPARPRAKAKEGQGDLF